MRVARKNCQAVAQALLVALLLGCGPTRSEWAERAYPIARGGEDFPERFGSIEVTPEGRYFTGEADGRHVDRIWNHVEGCLRDAFPSGLIDKAEHGAGWCHDDRRLLYPSRRSSVVVIVPDWRWNCGETWQTTRADAPVGGCFAKHREVTPECPCKWRSGFRDRNGRLVFYATPDLRMLPDAITRYATGCQNPWVMKKAIECARPVSIPKSANGSAPGPIASRRKGPNAQTEGYPTD